MKHEKSKDYLLPLKLFCGPYKNLPGNPLSFLSSQILSITEFA
jgi:hypothetical protein